jgi:hypothetical protein
MTFTYNIQDIIGVVIIGTVVVVIVLAVIASFMGRIIRYINKAIAKGLGL